MDNRFIVTGFFVIISFEILILAAIMIIGVGVKWL